MTDLFMCTDYCRKHSLVNSTLIATVTGTRVATIQRTNIATVTGTSVATIQQSASTQNPSFESLE